MQKQDRPLIGVFWMAVTGLCFVAVTVLVKHIGSDVPAAQGAFIRYFLGLVFLIPMIRPLLAVRLTRWQMKVFVARGVVHTLAVMSWFFAMARIPIADVTAMNYLSPVYTTLGAAVLLKEPLPPRRMIAVIIALVGAAIILRPGFREIETGHIAMLGTAVLFAASYLSAKLLSNELGAGAIVGMLSITVTIGLAPFAWAVWVPISMVNIGWLFLVACFATAGHFTMTYAFAAAPLTVTQPVTFLQLVWAVILGAVMFGEAIDGWVLLGGGVIMASVTFITWREARAKRSAKRVLTPSHHATKL